MAELKAKIEAEFENIDKVMNELTGPEDLRNLSALELAGLSALLHNFYLGMENILKQIIKRYT